MNTPLLSVTLFFYLHAQSQEIQYDSTIDILIQPSNNDIKSEHGVNVTRDNDKYVIEFNIKHGRKIQTHRASVQSDKLFDKATFSWKSANKVAVKLFNINSTDKFELMVWGEKRSTGMEVETDETNKL